MAKRKTDEMVREIGVPKDLVRAIMAAETKWIFDPAPRHH